MLGPFFCFLPRVDPPNIPGERLPNGWLRSEGWWMQVALQPRTSFDDREFEQVFNDVLDRSTTIVDRCD